MILYRIGHRGPQIARLQSMLNRQPGKRFHLAVDGEFGPRTQDAVQHFQTQEHQAPDGTVTDDVWHLLQQKARQRLTLTEPYWLRIACAEKSGRLSRRQCPDSSRIRAYHRLTRLRQRDHHTPCSSSFVNWVMHRAGLRGTNSAAPESWLEWGARLSQPALGAVTVIRRKGAKAAGKILGTEAGYLVGFFISRTATRIRLLGADPENRVTERHYDLSEYEVVSYRWPEPKRVRMH